MQKKPSLNETKLMNDEQLVLRVSAYIKKYSLFFIFHKQNIAPKVFIRYSYCLHVKALPLVVD